MSWDVGPAGLSTRRTPATGALGAAGELGTQGGDQLGVRQVGREAGRARVAAAGVAARDRADVDVGAGRAEAHLARGAIDLATVAHDRGEPRPLERADVVDDPLG